MGDLMVFRLWGILSKKFKYFWKWKTDWFKIEMAQVAQAGLYGIRNSISNRFTPIRICWLVVPQRRNENDPVNKYVRRRPLGARRAAWQEKRGQTAHALSPVHWQVDQHRYTHSKLVAECQANPVKRARDGINLWPASSARPVWCRLMMILTFMFSL